MSARTLRVSCLQINVGNNVAANIAVMTELTARAAQDGAQLVVTPEYCFKLDGRGAVMRQDVQPEGSHDGIAAAQELARQHGLWFLIGAAVVHSEKGKLANRSILIDPNGNLVARYDKLHMFDLTLPNGREIFESRTYRPGDSAQVVETPLGVLGLTICYDLRFANLFHGLAKAGAEVIVVPAAFYQYTGSAHWHVLLRARAIETGCFIVAPATCGTHPGDHATYGHSLIVSPWGEILTDGGAEPGVVTVDINLDEVAATRTKLPALRHARTFDVNTAVVS